MELNEERLVIALKSVLKCLIESIEDAEYEGFDNVFEEYKDVILNAETILSEYDVYINDKVDEAKISLHPYIADLDEHKLNASLKTPKTVNV